MDKVQNCGIYVIIFIATAMETCDPIFLCVSTQLLIPD
jgi:hypothetical protein